MTVTFDVSPKGLVEVERMLRNEEGVLRFFSLKVKASTDRLEAKNFKNPYTNRT